MRRYPGFPAARNMTADGGADLAEFAVVVRGLEEKVHAH
jgi:hypothetical protein